MDKLVKDVLAATESLTEVAKALHTPLDTSTLERAVKALASEARKLERVEEKKSEEASKPTPRPAAQ